jgi:hypothetical protein
MKDPKSKIVNEDDLTIDELLSILRALQLADEGEEHYGNAATEKRKKETQEEPEEINNWNLYIKQK